MNKLIVLSMLTASLACASDNFNIERYKERMITTLTATFGAANAKALWRSMEEQNEQTMQTIRHKIDEMGKYTTYCQKPDNIHLDTFAILKKNILADELL